MNQSLKRLAVEESLKEAGLSGSLLEGMMALVSASLREDERATIRGEALPTLAAVARRFHHDSLLRSDILHHQVEDASWNMMLALYADMAEGRRTTVTSACYASGVPSTTALRHLERMRADGLLKREDDPDDRRRTLVTLTPDAFDRTSTMIRRFCVSPPANDPWRDTPCCARCGASMPPS